MQNATTEAIASGLKKYRSILIAAKNDGLNEDETVRRIIGVLVDVLGYDRYEEVLSQFETLGDRCDLAIRLKGSSRSASRKPDMLIECKKAGLPLRADHLRQAVKYAVLNGVKWAVLTNGLVWQVFSVAKKPGKDGHHERLIATADLENAASAIHAVEVFAALSREGLKRDALDDIETKSTLFNRYVCAQLIMLPSTVEYLCGCFDAIGVKNVSPDDIQSMLQDVFAPGVATDSKNGVMDAIKHIRKLGASLPLPPAPASSTACESPAAPAPSQNPSVHPCADGGEFTFTAKGITARCRRTADGFMVFAGQPVAPNLAPSARGTSVERQRVQLMSEGVIADGKFTRDHVFRSNSAAASVILGSGVSGNATWKPA